jgi:hypothetical protein
MRSRPKSTPVLATLLSLAVLLVQHEALAASPPTAEVLSNVIDRFVGSYKFSGGDRERKAHDEAIEDVVSEMNFLVRSIARKRLREGTRIPSRVEISRKGNQLTLTFDGRVYSAPINGGAVEVETVTGDTVELRYRVSGKRIEQHFAGDDGGRVNVMILGDDGNLKMKVRVFSSKLPKDLRFELTYSR